MSATVTRYLDAITAPKRRGRPISNTTVERRLSAAKDRLHNSVGVQKVLAAQEVRDLQARLARSHVPTETDILALEAAFVKIAKRFSDNRGITYGAWRDAGVPSQVLLKAGIKRTRGPTKP